MTKSWNHNPDVKKRQEFPRRSKTKLRRTIFRIRSVSDSPVSISSCSSATRSRESFSARGPRVWSARAGVGRTSTDRSGCEASEAGQRSPRSRGLFYRKRQTTLRNSCGSPVRTEQTSHTGTAGTQAQLTGPSGWSAAGAARRAHTNPSRRPTNDTGTMRQCPRSPDTTTAQADKPQPIPMKPSGKQHALLKVSALGTP